MKAVNSELSYVQTCSCNCPFVYRTMWDILCNQLFMQLPPPGIDEDNTFQEVKILNEGVITMTKTTAPYTFTIEIETDTPPKASDVIYFGKQFYIIGAVSASSNTYACTGCLSIDISIVGVYAALVSLQNSVSGAETSRATAESGRVLAESGRVDAESGRVAAESQRSHDFATAQDQRAAAYTLAEAARQAAFEEAEAARTAELGQIAVSFMVPIIIPGEVGSGDRRFYPGVTTHTATEARTRFYSGQRTYLSVEGLGVEDILADDGTYLVTRSGWKWKY